MNNKTQYSYSLTNRFLPSLFILLLFLIGCEYHSEEDLYGITECQTEDVTYSGDVVPILENNCYVCHGTGINQGGITLEGYDNLRFYVESGQFLGAIQHEPGYSPMPQGSAQLPKCDIEKMVKWVNEGAQDN